MKFLVLACDAQSRGLVLGVKVQGQPAMACGNMTPLPRRPCLVEDSMRASCATGRDYEQG